MAVGEPIEHEFELAVRVAIVNSLTTPAKLGEPVTESPEIPAPGDSAVSPIDIASDYSSDGESDEPDAGGDHQGNTVDKPISNDNDPGELDTDINVDGGEHALNAGEPGENENASDFNGSDEEIDDEELFFPPSFGFAKPAETEVPSDSETDNPAGPYSQRHNPKPAKPSKRFPTKLGPLESKAIELPKVWTDKPKNVTVEVATEATKKDTVEVATEATKKGGRRVYACCREREKQKTRRVLGLPMEAAQGSCLRTELESA